MIIKLKCPAISSLELMLDVEMQDAGKILGKMKRLLSISDVTDKKTASITHTAVIIALGRSVRDGALVLMLMCWKS